MARLVRQAVWSVPLTAADAIDKVTVRNLEATVAAGVDVWGRKKVQRALVTVTLTLTNPFDSAAEADSLDNSTVHYGELSKAIKSLIDVDRGATHTSAGHSSTGELVRQIALRAVGTASKTPILTAEVDVFYPKGSMLGDGAGMSYAHYVPQDDGLTSKVLYLRNVRVPCIIGVNPNERLRKQPVIVSLWIECLPDNRSDDYVELEEVVVEAISSSSFETLESLSTMVVQELREKFFRKEDEDAFIRLRVEKPMAVPFADAPAIEILRPVKVRST